MFEHPIRIGDNINVADVSGSVEDVRVLSTVIKTYDGIYIRIPNEKVFTSNITNYVHNAARRFTYEICIRYQDDADAAIRIAKGVIETHPPFALKSPAPSVFVDNLGGRRRQPDRLHLGAGPELVGRPDGSPLEDQTGARRERHRDALPAAHRLVRGRA